MVNDSYEKKYLKYKFKYLSLKNTIIQKGGGNKIDLMLFKADWCGHCKTFIPVWNELKSQYKGKFNFITFDSDKNKNEIDKWDVKGFPTLLIKKNDSVEDYSGPRDIDYMIKFLDDLN